MSKWYCQLNNGGGSTRTDLPGGGTWSRVYYNNTSGDTTTGPTNLATLQAAQLALWNDIKGTILDTNKLNGARTGLYIGDRATGSGTLTSFMPATDATVRPPHLARSSRIGVAGVLLGASDGFTPPGGADSVTYTESLYTTAVAAMDVIRAGSFDYQPGTNRARSLATYQMTDDGSTVWWDDNPTWLTFAECMAQDGSSHWLVTWQADNSADTYWAVEVWAKRSSTWARETTTAVAVSAGTYDTGFVTVPEEVRIYLVRNDDRRAFQTMDAPVPCVGGPVVTACTSSLELNSCGVAGLSTGTVTLSPGLGGTYEIYWMFRMQINSYAWTDWEWKETTTGTDLDASASTTGATTITNCGGPTARNLRTQWWARVRVISNGVFCDSMVSTNDDTQSGYICTECT